MAQMEQASKIDYRAELRKFIGNNFVLRDGLENLKDDDSLLEKGIVDSTGILELVGFVEDKFDFRVEDEELIPDNLDSINNLVAYIEKKVR
jgi:acyl carrier protein